MDKTPDKEIEQEFNEYKKNNPTGKYSYKDYSAGRSKGLEENTKLRKLLKIEVEATGGNWETYKNIHHLKP